MTENENEWSTYLYSGETYVHASERQVGVLFSATSISRVLIECDQVVPEFVLKI